jgi:hypothetical protein
MGARCGLVVNFSNVYQRAHWKVNRKGYFHPKADRTPPLAELRSDTQTGTATPLAADGDEFVI